MLTKQSSPLSHHARSRTHGQCAPIRNHKSTRGFSIVELMVALMISSIILVAVVQIFVSSKATYQLDEGLARLQENGRFAMDFITKEIRLAGNYGCIGDFERFKDPNKTLLINYLSSPAFSNLSTGVQGFEAINTGPATTVASSTTVSSTVTDWSPSLDINLIPSAIRGTDIIVVRHFSSETYPVTSITPTQVLAKSASGISDGDIVLLSNCQKAAVFQANNTSTAASVTTIEHEKKTGSLNLCTTWGDPSLAACVPTFEPPDASKEKPELSRFVTTVFYIGPGTNGPALFQRTFGSGAAVTSELIEGVESMQILYGIDTEALAGRYHDANQYVPASNVTNWQQVVSVRISLLIRTSVSNGQADQAIDTTPSYTLAGTAVTPFADRQRRRVFNTTVNLRNR